MKNIKKIVGGVVLLCMISCGIVSCNNQASSIFTTTRSSIKAVSVNIKPGIIDSNTLVTLETPSPAATIYYTLDGSTPDKTSSYGEMATSLAQVTIKGKAGSSVVLKVIACAQGASDSPLSAFSYTIKGEKDNSVPWVEITPAKPINQGEGGNTGGEILAGENQSLFLGNPSGAKTDVAMRDNYLMEKEQYSLSYNDTKLTANWVAWHLEASNMGSVKRKNNFREDESLPQGFYRVGKNYYHSTYYFDRGHMCPSGERTDTKDNNSATFYMTNMVPQAKANNQVVWNHLEAYERDACKDSKEAYIYCGVLGKGGTSRTGNHEYVDLGGGKKVTVPAFTWKIVLLLEKGNADLSRITKDTEVICVKIPNTETCKIDKGWRDYTISIDVLEEELKDESGIDYDFFSEVPDAVESLIEAKTYR